MKTTPYKPPQTADTLPGKAKDAVAEVTGQTEEEFPEKSATFMEQVAEQTGRYVQQFKDALTSSGKTAKDEAGKVGTAVTKGWGKEKDAEGEDAEDKEDKDKDTKAESAPETANVGSVPAVVPVKSAPETTAIESASGKPKIAKDEVIKAPEEKHIA